MAGRRVHAVVGRRVALHIAGARDYLPLTNDAPVTIAVLISFIATHNIG